jgi:ABC-type multidrug transport system ATPase subunit
VSGDSQIPAAYIQQSVSFFPHMTVRETLVFRVELHLGSTLTKSQRDTVVTDLMDQLNLSKSANTIVGNAKVRGLSGGERKRLSIACEMVNSPSLIFLDEPTSGLDSYQAQQVVETLRKLADAGKTVVAVIHQPSQNAFSMFDDLLLVSEGKQMYFGEVDKVRSYFESMGYSAPKETGTAEHILDCISKVANGETSGAEQESLDRIDTLAAKAAVAELAMPKNTSSESKRYAMSKGVTKANIFVQFKLLLGRSLNEAFRGKTAIIIKIVQQVTLGLVYGGIYHLGNNQASIQDRIGLLSLIAIGTMNMGMAGTIRAFPKEKAIVSSEIASRLYGTLPYFLAKAIAEIPLIGTFTTIFGAIVYTLTGLQRGKGKFQTFLGIVSLHAVASEAAGLMIGAVSSSSDVALALFPVAIVLNIIFDGKNISEENTPRLLRWIPKIGLIRWGFEGLAVNEFDGLEFDTSGPKRGPMAKTGQDALARLGMDGKTVAQVVTAQTRIIAACWLMSFLGLSLTRQKFLIMESIPVPVDTEDETDVETKKES